MTIKETTEGVYKSFLKRATGMTACLDTESIFSLISVFACEAEEDENNGKLEKSSCYLIHCTDGETGARR